MQGGGRLSRILPGSAMGVVDPFTYPNRGRDLCLGLSSWQQVKPQARGLKRRRAGVLPHMGKT